jgi:Na+-translocating ferredoxin:NAD+ oxidoreductase RnfD subunit
MGNQSPVVTLKRFLRTPKGLLLIVLLILVVLAGLGEGISLVAPGLAAAVGVAAVIDALALRIWKGKWVFPSGAILTGLIVAMILSPRQPAYVAAVTATVAVVSKYPFRGHTANVFNPAALALVITFYPFGTAQDWWGALAEITPAGLAVLLATGVFITHRVNRVPVVLSFLGVYYLLVTLTAFLGDPSRVAELYRAPDLQAALFFAFFMVTDPPTSPHPERDQLVYGAIVAVVAYGVFQFIGAAYFLLAGLLVANVWEAWRRSRAAATRLGSLAPSRAD